MKKPITITPAMMQEMQDAFLAECERAKLTDGRVSFSREYKFPDADTRKAKIHFTMDAYDKMTKIIDEFSSEVAWHGFVERVSETEFIINDIVVYPQVVTGSTVNTDQEEYTKWLDQIDFELFNTMHFQGHSHVHMAVSPSAVDINHQSEIIKQLRSDDFYIFMIWNKRREFFAKVYDMASNTLYEGNDVEVTYDYDDRLDKFVEDAKAMVRTKTYTAPATYVGAAARGAGAQSSRVYDRHWWDSYDNDDGEDDSWSDIYPYGGQKRGKKDTKKDDKGGNDVYTGGVIDYSGVRGASV